MAQSEPANSATSTVAVRLIVNGTPRSLTLDARSSLLDVLRERLALTGAKKRCDHGHCDGGGGDPSYRVVRGSSWRNETQHVRAAFRVQRNINVRFDTLGFRVARTIKP